MKQYYTLSYQCPSCLEPYASGYAQKQLHDLIYNCSRCHAIYSHRRISIDRDSLVSIINPLLQARISRFLDLSSINSKFWKIENNDMEISYIDYSIKMKGVNIITWPWPEARFIPIMVSEMLTRSDKSKIVVIGKSDYPDGSYVHSKVDIISNMKNLFYIENRSSDTELHKFIKKELKHIDIFRETNLIKVNISYTGPSKYTRVRDFYGVRLKTVREMLSADDDSIEWTSDRDGNTGNNDAIIKLSKIKKKNFPLSQDYHYQKWLSDVIDNSDSIVFPFHELTHGPFSLSGNLLYIEESQGIKGIQDHIKAFKPNFIIIENLDSFHTMFNDSRALFRTLLSFNITLIAFSTNRDIRTQYLPPWDIKFGMENGIIFHALDNDRIMDYYKNHQTRNTYPSILSSGKYVDYHPNYPGYNTIMPDYMKKFENLDSYAQSVDEKERGTFKRFLEYLQVSPLPAFEGEDAAMYYDKNTGSWMDCYKIYQYLSTNKDNFIASLHAIYDEYPISPAIATITQQISDIKSKYGTNSAIFVAVPSSDAKKIQHLMMKQDLPSDVTFGKWADLIQYKEKELYVITSIIPDYIYPDKVKMIYFSGNEKRVDEFQLKMKYQLNNFSSRPFIRPDNRSIPEFLYNMYADQSLNINERHENDDIKTFNYKILESVSDHLLEDPPDNKPYYIRTLKKDSSLYVFYDEDNNPLVITPGSSIIILNPGFTEFKVTEQLSNAEENAIKGKYMIVRNSTTYMSFKDIFIKLMDEYGNRIKFERGIYVWDNFKYLYENSIRWKLDIYSAVKVLAAKNNIDEEEAKNIIAREITSSGIFAKNEEYIKLWMDIMDKSYEVINIERPHSLDDLYKIYLTLEKYGVKVDSHEIKKCYFAILTLQKFRQDTVKRNSKDIGGDAEFIHDRIAENLSMMPKFHIYRICKGVIKNDLNMATYNTNEILDNLSIIP